MEQFLPLLTNLVTGAVGGNVAGAALKDKSLGMVGNTVAGLVGGGIGGQVLAGLISNMGVQGLSGMGGDVASSGIGGALALAVVSYAKPYVMPYITQLLNKQG
jgi:uncharacterized membrane protein YeaQ/YmgE (transglycosylase-associated protein family)